MVAKSTVVIYGKEALDMANGLAKHVAAVGEDMDNAAERAEEVLSSAKGLAKHQNVDKVIKERPTENVIEDLEIIENFLDRLTDNS